MHEATKSADLAPEIALAEMLEPERADAQEVGQVPLGVDFAHQRPLPTRSGQHRDR